MPCWSQPRRRASLLNSAALSTYSSRRLAAHRPDRLHAEPLQPGPLVGGHVRQAQPDRQSPTAPPASRPGPPTHAAEHIDRHRDVRAADRQPMLLVDHDHVDRVWSICTCSSRPVDRRRHTASRPQRPGRVASLAAPRRGHRVQLRDPARPARPATAPAAREPGTPARPPGARPPPSAAAASDTGSAAPPERSPRPRRAAARAPRPPLDRPGIRSDTTPSPCTPPPQQRVHLAPGNTAARSGLVRVRQPHRGSSRPAARSPRPAAPRHPTPRPERSAPRARPPLHRHPEGLLKGRAASSGTTPAVR